jgi:hypothetical protein
MGREGLTYIIQLLKVVNKIENYFFQDVHLIVVLTNMSLLLSDRFSYSNHDIPDGGVFMLNFCTYLSFVLSKYDIHYIFSVMPLTT